MKVIVINAGSSSLKFQLFDMENEKVLSKGICERIGIDGRYTQKNADGKEINKAEIPMANHVEAFATLVKNLTTGEYAVISDVSEIKAVGHRIVHGGDLFDKSILITPEVIKEVSALSSLAPLHNPACIQGVEGCLKVFGESVPQVAVFDTAFHQTMPAKNYMYAIPYEYYEKYKIRKYGFHGTSHRFVTARCAELMGKDVSQLKIVTCHLGNGSSIAAVDGGKSVDTTMGLTPLEGVVMGTRCGSIDPSIVTTLMEKENLTTQQVNDILNKKSGVIGLGGVSSDERDNTAAAESGNERVKMAQEQQRASVKKYLAAMAASMGGLDVVVFTGGIGENAPNFREAVCTGMEFMGIEFDAQKNAEMKFGKEGEISKDGSKVKVLVIPTNEELLIARDTVELAFAK